MKKMCALLLICMGFFSIQSAHAGLIGESIIFTVYYNILPDPNGPYPNTTGTGSTEEATIESPSTSYFGITIDDTTIKIMPGYDVFMMPTVLGAAYTIQASDGSLPELDWATFAATYPNVDLSQDLTELENGFVLGVDNPLGYSSNFVFSISVLGAGDGTVAVPEPPMIGILAIGLIGFIHSRRQKHSDRHPHSPA
jgi:hypothetical protein